MAVMLLMILEKTKNIRMTNKNSRSYSELIKLTTFKDRYNYLKLGGDVGDLTFGGARHLNQLFYKSDPWRDIRSYIIVRDNGCDLGFDGYEIFGRIIVHHINPVSINDLKNRASWLLDPNFLICTSLLTHNAIHYGDSSYLETLQIVDRREGDTTLW